MSDITRLTLEQKHILSEVDTRAKFIGAVSNSIKPVFANTDVQDLQLDEDRVISEIVIDKEGFKRDMSEIVHLSPRLINDLAETVFAPNVETLVQRLDALDKFIAEH